jgi:predicted RNA methylase
MKIANDILNILDKCTIEQNTVFLTCGQLDRKTYEAVNKCLESIGGKWNKKAKGHVFEDDPVELLDNLILTGETIDLKKQYQFFPTPRVVAEIMCDMAELKPESKVLEPSIGKGDLADVIYERGIAELIGVELNRDMDKHLKNKPYTSMTGINFLDFADEVQDGKIRQDWDRIIMNPPFAKQQDIDHVYAAYAILAKSGVLVSVVSEGPFFRENKKSVDFREWLDDIGAEVIENDVGAFKESGTMVKTRIIKIAKLEASTNENQY